jgi:hypothetical protein
MGLAFDPTLQIISSERPALRFVPSIPHAKAQKAGATTPIGGGHDIPSILNPHASPI